MKEEHYIPTRAYYKIFKRIPLAERVKKRKRPDIGTLEDVQGQKIYSRKVTLKDGYDSGGAYWTPPRDAKDKVLYVDYTVDLQYVHFSWKGKEEKQKQSKYSTVAKSNSVIVELLELHTRENVGSREEATLANKKIYCRELILKNGIDTGGYYWGKDAIVVVYFTEDKSFILWEKPQYGASEKAKQLLK